MDLVIVILRHYCNIFIFKVSTSIQPPTMPFVVKTFAKEWKEASPEEMRGRVTKIAKRRSAPPIPVNK